MTSPQRVATRAEHDPAFRNLSPPLAERLEGLLYRREYETRQIVYFPDDPCDYVYWVRHGRIRLTRVSPGHRELTYRHALPGDAFGEECLAAAPRRGHYAEALDTSTLYLLRAADFRRLMRDEAEFALRIAEGLAGRIALLESRLADTVFLPVRNRVAAGLLRLHEQARAHQHTALRITHQELANLVGSARETTTAVLHALRDEGILALSNRRVEVLDAAGLGRAAIEV